MSTPCPNGHGSEWPDWCSVCGERIGADPTAPSPEQTPAAAQSPATSPPAPAATPASGPTCDNCGVPRHEHDMFCESCGYDFASGSLPEPGSGPDTASSAAHAPMHVKICIDADFFSASVGEAELALPDPIPPMQVVPLTGVRILIGRTSTSRGVFPEIDVRALTDDPAVSTQHAMLERAADGTWTLTDLGSTNGTFLTLDVDDPIDSGTAQPFADGAAMYIGAWTRIELATTTS